jgi:hypothetical protein
MSEQAQVRERNFDAWVQTAIRFFVLTNAGAAVATLSFLATWATPGFSRGTSVVALACFVAGMIVAGICIMAQLTGAYRAFLSDHLSDPDAISIAVGRSWATRYFDNLEPRTAPLMVLAFALFVLGCMVGMAGLIASVS